MIKVPKLFLVMFCASSTLYLDDLVSRQHSMKFRKRPLCNVYSLNMIFQVNKSIKENNKFKERKGINVIQNLPPAKEETIIRVGFKHQRL